MRITDLQAEREKLLIPRDGSVHGRGRSITERVEDIPEEDYDEGTLFPKGFFEGDEKSAKNIIDGRLPCEVTVSLLSAEVPSPRGGLLDPDKEGQVLVSYEVAGYPWKPKREGAPGDKRLVGWKVRQQIRPTYVQTGRFYTREDVITILAELGVEGDPRVDELLA